MTRHETVNQEAPPADFFATGIGLLVVGVIALGTQVARRAFGLALEGFWIVVGILFLLGGFGALLEVNVPMLPLVLVGAGILLLLSALMGKR